MLHLITRVLDFRESDLIQHYDAGAVSIGLTYKVIGLADEDAFFCRRAFGFYMNGHFFVKILLHGKGLAVKGKVLVI